MTPAIVAGWSAASLWTAFLVGLAGGVGHCVGMCGPLAAAAGFASGARGRAGSPADGPARADAGAGIASVALWQLAYHGGRLLTYSSIGAGLGALGSVWALRGALAPVQRWVWLVAGVVMVALGAAVAGAGGPGRALEAGAGRLTAGWLRGAADRLTAAGPWAALPLGALNGLLPCGLVMSVAASALAAGSPALGAATMLAFGLGTVPALAGFGAASGLVGARARGWLLRAAALLVIGYGIVTIARSTGVLPGLG